MRIGIVGGGVYGTAIAYFLKEIGDPEVVLFEKDSIGSASTGKSAGIVRHHYSHEIQIRFAKRGSEILAELPDRLGTDGGFHQNGYLIIAGEEDEAQFRHNISLQQTVGVDVELIAPSDLDEYVPGLRGDDIAVAALEHDAGFADPYLVATGFARKAEELGATINTNTPVVDLEVEDGEVTTIQTAEDSHSVDFVVNAAGPWAANVANMVDIDLPLKRYEAKVAALSASKSYSPEYPTVSDIGQGLYAKPEGTGDFIAGGMEREGGHEPLADRTDLEGVTNTDFEQLGAMIEHRLPRFADAGVVEPWSEFITAPPDWHQIIGIPKTMKNFYVAAGGSGHGFKEAPGFAESIAEDILGETPSNELSAYHLQRFEEDNLFTGGYSDGSRS
ncbi:NAD(P)/FAD-dependent oxidoreductase [Halorussus marinus]|uniref:NAD(P)/FAD-dependent oxidoreductase n=1 Tax=Halorussus marinus TaxID=2505976 RepID=UPI001092117C|nr:FAD-dependent oxidoreductase [Halorussus marinus]